MVTQKSPKKKKKKKKKKNNKNKNFCRKATSQAKDISVVIDSILTREEARFGRAEGYGADMDGQTAFELVAGNIALLWLPTSETQQ